MSILLRIHRWRIWVHPIVTWLAHAAQFFGLACAIGVPVLSIASYYPWYPHTAGFTVYTALLWAPWLTALPMLMHIGQDCPRCAALTQPGTETPRHVRGAMWTLHNLIAVSLFLVAFWVADEIVTMPQWLGRIWWVLVALNFTWAARSIVLHNAHWRSCLKCKKWRDDELASRESAPDPTPPGHTATA